MPGEIILYPDGVTLAQHEDVGTSGATMIIGAEFAGGGARRIMPLVQRCPRVALASVGTPGHLGGEWSSGA